MRAGEYSGKMKLIVLLMLSTLIVEGIAMHTCGRPVPESCRNNSRIRIMKSDKHYRLNLCKNHPDCLHRSPEDWFECNDVCEVCRSLPGQPGTNTHAHKAVTIERCNRLRHLS